MIGYKVVTWLNGILAVLTAFLNSKARALLVGVMANLCPGSEVMEGQVRRDEKTLGEGFLEIYSILPGVQTWETPISLESIPPGKESSLPSTQSWLQTEKFVEQVCVYSIRCIYPFFFLHTRESWSVAFLFNTVGAISSTTPQLCFGFNKFVAGPGKDRRL